MALLLFQFSIVFTIGIVLNGAVLSGSAFRVITSDGPESPLKFEKEPELYVLAPSIKNVSTFLHCSVILNFHVPPIIREPFIHQNNPNFDSSPHQEEYEDDVTHLNDDDEYYDDSNRTEDSERQKRIDLKYKQQLDNRSPNSIPFNYGKNNDADPEDESSDSLLGGFPLRNRRNIDKNNPLKYTWFRNGNKLLATTSFYDDGSQESAAGFKLFSNGTLRIRFSNLTAGTYRCLVNETYFNKGALISRNSVVELATLVRDINFSSINVTVASKNHAIVLNCPIVSVPLANVTWYFNKSMIKFEMGLKQESRYFRLNNGSLLIVNAQESDSGKYKCNATNVFTQKFSRSSGLTLNVLNVQANDSTSKLLAPLQSLTQNIKSGENLILYCAGYLNKIEWNFTPRHSSIPIKLNNFYNQLKFVNVSLEKHDGIYNCSAENDYQLFNVTILTPPVFTQPLKSVVSSVAASLVLNCSVSGNPMPTITWYKNGQLIENSYVRHYEYPLFKIRSLEPEDEGIYQCFAKNKHSEVNITNFLSIRNLSMTTTMPESPKNLMCYPTDYNGFLVTFDTNENEKIDMISYYLATDNPYQWISPSPVHNKNKNGVENSVNITMDSISNIVPFKPYMLYLRGIRMTSTSDDSVLITKMSPGVQCATQGLPLYWINFPSGIFIWWKHTDNVNVTAFSIQFEHENQSHPVIFTDQVVGTYRQMSIYGTWADVEKDLVKINAQAKIIKSPKSGRNIRSLNYSFRNRQGLQSRLTETGIEVESLITDPPANSNGTITEVRVPGNVSGILIPNSNFIIVRVLASTSANGEPLDQDLRFLRWKTINWTSKKPEVTKKLEISEFESRSVTLTWEKFSEDDEQCYELCHKNMNPDIVIRNGGPQLTCEIINIEDKTSHTIRNLLPFNPYNFFLSYCSEKEAISNVLSERTKKDAPGPVSGHLIFKDNGIVLEWQDPINPNGLLDHYWIQWNLGNESKAINISATESCFRFPNTTNEDIFNITIRALGESGIGNPLYINLANFKDIPALEARTRNWNTPIFVVSLVVSIFILIILLCVIACNMRLKSSKNSTSTIQISQPPPMTIPVDNICNIDMQEMQTLITRTDINIPNGRPHENRLEGQTNGTPNEMQRILIVTSTPNKSHNEEIDQDDEVPVFGMELPANEIVQISIADPTFIKKPINGQKLNVQNVHYFKSLHNSQKPNSPLSPAAAVEHPEKYSPKLQVIPNGNLRITENPQYLPNSSSFNSSSTPSIFDNSQQKLLDDSSLDSNLFAHQQSPNYKNFNNNNERVKVGKADSIETEDGDEEDDEATTFDINDSNLSSKPLHTKNWNFQRPLVGPNG